MAKTLPETYIAAVRELWGPGYWVTWQPSVRLRLGDVGAVEGGQFVPVTSLADLDVSFRQDKAQARDDLVSDSSGHASVRFKLAGKSSEAFSVLSRVDAGAAIEFHGQAATVLSMAGLREDRIVDLPTLAADLTRALWDGRWSKNFVVVSHVVVANSGTIVISAGDGGRCELRVVSSIGVGPTRLADLAGSVEVAHTEKVGFHLASAKNLTPYFRALRIRTSWRRKVSVEYSSRQPLESASPVPADLRSIARAYPDNVFEAAVPNSGPPQRGVGA